MLSIQFNWLFQPTCLLNIAKFSYLHVYSNLHVYLISQNFPSYTFIPTYTSIRNSRVACWGNLSFLLLWKFITVTVRNWNCVTLCWYCGLKYLLIMRRTCTILAWTQLWNFLMLHMKINVFFLPSRYTFLYLVKWQGYSH